MMRTRARMRTRTRVNNCFHFLFTQSLYNKALGEHKAETALAKILPLIWSLQVYRYTDETVYLYIYITITLYNYYTYITI